MADRTNKTILVFGAMEQPAQTQTEQTLGITSVPLEAIKANMEVVLAEVIEVFDAIRQKLGNGRIEQVEITLGIAVDGSVGIFGAGVGAGATGGMTVQIKFDQ